MERLWTPWRRTYLEHSGDDGPPADDACFLCTAPAAHDDRAKLILFRGELAFALLNLYPYNNGHVLIAPYLHTSDLAHLEPPIAQDMLALTQRCVDVLERAYQPDAFNVGMNLGRAAGAGVPDHLHTHVVPRWGGDTSFMTVVGDTRVLPETLDQTFTRLEPLFHA